MSDTIGQLIDKIATINNKTFVAQDDIYRIRRMSWEEFKEEFTTEEGTRAVYEMLKKSCDLNVQRSYAVTELDRQLVDLIMRAVKGEDLLDSNAIQDQRKNY